MAQEKRGYALKVERGERPFIYSDKYYAWRKAANDRALREAADAHLATLSKSHQDNVYFLRRRQERV